MTAQRQHPAPAVAQHRAATTVDEPPPNGGVRATALAMTSTVVGALPVFLLGGLSVLIGSELAFSASALGLSVAAFFLTSSLASVPAGRISERFGARRATILSASVSAATLAGIGLVANQWVVLTVLLLVAGLANALSQVSANVWVAHAVTPDRRGLAFGVKQSAIPMGTLLSGAALPLVGLTLGWRAAFILAGVVGGATIAALLPRSEGSPPREAHSGRLDMAASSLGLLAVAGGMCAAAANSLGTFLVASLVECCLSPAAAGALLVVGSVAGITGRVVGGAYVDRRDGQELHVVAAMMVIGAAGMWLIGSSASLPLLVVGVVVAFAAGWGWNGIINAAMVRLNPRAPATATGVTQTGLYIGAVVGPPLFGVTFDQLGVQAAWSGASVLAIVGGCLVIVAARHHRKRGMR